MISQWLVRLRTAREYAARHKIPDTPMGPATQYLTRTGAYSRIESAPAFRPKSAE